ncbi:hypothetical protein [Anabaena subtropica]|uniref:Peptidase C-terminal archaeal/bacterial domain-containing protein n=1 Tax=Anabaena subtropica FACHB-260 TaxID=2692884 RepID=A0ABR8CSE6_9NOST|nr:hypothetical protein [Anabaena subtropica]MBD2346116.1 hypothetical protein [Anabaena subtropica FACHB-260]
MAVNFFDVNFYRQANPDLASVGLTTDNQLLSHFQASGLNEGRAFSVFVDLNFYRASNIDLETGGLTRNQQLLEHLQNYGVAEGRKFSPFVDVDFYLSINPDINQAYRGDREQSLQHLRNHGVSEGRKFSPFVDINYYLDNNTDIKNFYGGNRVSSLQHMRLYGINEGRKFSPFVDLNLYIGMSSNITAVSETNRIGALQHLASYGITDGTKFSIAYDTNHYRSANSDLMAARLSNLQLFQHFQRHGLSEGRTSAQVFSVKYYLNANTDLVRLGFNHLQAFQHFNTYGYREGRIGNTPITLNSDPGNTLASAFNLSFPRSVHSNVYRNFVGINDTNDFYQFQLAYTSTVNITVNEVTQGIYVYLFQDTNNNGVFDNPDIDYYSSGFSYSAATLNKTLGAGSYFLLVKPYYNDGNTNYTLRLTTTPSTVTTPRDPGNTLATALGISPGQSFTDFVGIADSQDYYRFTLGSTNNVNVTVNGLSEGVYVYLFRDTNNNGVFDSPDMDYYSSGFSYSAATLNKTLGAGSYFLLVKPYYSDGNTNYTLRLTTTPSSVTTPRDPGNTLATALGISSGQSFTDFVGIADSQDYYRFTLGSTNNVNVTVNGLSEGVYVYLFQDTNNNGVFDSPDMDYYSSGFSYSAATLNKTLGAGSYLLLVKPYYSDGNTNYTLRLTTTPSSVTTPRDPGNTLATALGISSGQSFTDFVGIADSHDYYRFTLGNTSNVNVTINGLTEGVDVYLFQDTNNNGVFDSPDIDYYSSGFSYSAATINRTLGAGTYFTLVKPYYDDGNTNYTLRLTY